MFVDVVVVGRGEPRRSHKAVCQEAAKSGRIEGWPLGTLPSDPHELSDIRYLSVTDS